MASTFYGVPLNIPNRSLTSVLIVEPTLGISLDQPSVDVPLGSTPSSDNYIMREGALEPRPMISLYESNPQPMGAIPILGGMEVIDVGGNRLPLVSGTTAWAWYSVNSWSVLSYVSAFGQNIPPSGSDLDYWDHTQIYYAGVDENLAIGANGSYQSLYCWKANDTVFSTLTGAPPALTVAAFDNFILAANIRSGGSEFVQRVQWSDRGSASSWTQGLAGFEDLLTMRGDIKRLLPLENRIAVLGENEIWQGYRVDFPNLFLFQPLDTSVGCPYPWTAAVTPRGIIFLGRDYYVYLLPKEGGQPIPISQRLHRSIRNLIDRPERAWGAWDNTTGVYQLNYPIKGGSGRPQRAAWLQLDSGSWAPQSYDPVAGSLSLTRGFEVQRSSSATTWGGLQAAGIVWGSLNMTWADLAGASEERAILTGSSAGTLYYFNSNATSDNGTAVRSYWQSSSLGGESPTVMKTMTRLYIDYQADSSSSLSVSVSQNQGASFDLANSVALLPAASGVSQTRVDTYTPARYPCFKVESEGARYRLYRFDVELRYGGRG
jgi:hypothetical protein